MAPACRPAGCHGLVCTGPLALPITEVGSRDAGAYPAEILWSPGYIQERLWSCLAYSPPNFKLCPNFSFLVLRYFALCGLEAISMGMFSTISSP